MSGPQGKVRACEECGLTIRREEFLSHAAARYKGKLLCPKCVQAVKVKLAAARDAGDPGVASDGLVDVPVALVEEEEAEVADDGTGQIHGFSGSELTVKLAEREYKRPLLKDSPLATRCKTFHCKLTDASVQHLNDQINEWVDDHPDVQIKFALSDVGVVEGKHTDPHLIVTVFY